MAPFTKLFSFKRLSKDSLNLRDGSTTTSLAPHQTPALGNINSSSRPKAWAKVRSKYDKVLIKTQKAATSLKQFSCGSCIAKPSVKDDDFLGPVSDIVVRSSSTDSVYFECQKSFSESSTSSKVEDEKKRPVGNRKERTQAERQAQQVQMEVVADGWAGEWQGDGWDCAPGVCEHIIMSTGLGRLIDDEDDEQGDLVLLGLCWMYMEVDRNGWSSLWQKILRVIYDTNCWLDSMGL